MQKAIWIWENRFLRYDEFAQFRESLLLNGPEGKVSVRISTDADYALYVNGTLTAFGRYADLPHCKVVNTYDLSVYFCAGENTVIMDVWYHGAPSSIYHTGKPGLFYEFHVDGQLAAVSGSHTLCRKHPNYLSYREKMITKELGFSLCYDAAGEEIPWHSAEPTGYAPMLHERPIFPLTLEELRPGTLLRSEENKKYILDLSREEAGFLEFSLESSTWQNIVISHSEHLVNAEVPRFIGARDFSL